MLRAFDAQKLRNCVNKINLGSRDKAREQSTKISHREFGGPRDTDRESLEGVGRDLEIRGLYSLGPVERDKLAGSPGHRRRPAGCTFSTSMIYHVFTPISDFQQLRLKTTYVLFNSANLTRAILHH